MYLTINIYPEKVIPQSVTGDGFLKLVEFEERGSLVFYEHLNTGNIYTFNKFTGECLSDIGIPALPKSAPIRHFLLDPGTFYKYDNFTVFMRQLNTTLVDLKKDRNIFNIIISSISNKDFNYTTKSFRISDISIKYSSSDNEFILTGKLENPKYLGMGGKVSISRALGGITEADLIKGEESITFTYGRRDFERYIITLLIYPEKI